MESHTHTSFFLIATLLLLSTASAASTTTTSRTLQLQQLFVKNACNSTTYPLDCYNSLSPLASRINSDPKKLCIYALTQALGATKTSCTAVKKLKKMKGIKEMDAEVVDDCVENIKDAISVLSQSLGTMKAINGTETTSSDMEDVKTWVSAAITDDDTCTEGFDDEDQGGGAQSSSFKLRKQIKKNISVVAKSTSNALALINHLGPTY